MRAVEKKIKTRRARRVKILISSCKMKMGMKGGDHCFILGEFIVPFVRKNEFSDAISTQCF